MKSLLEQIQTRCRFFTGIQHDRCNKGVLYRDVRDTSQNPYRWPCFSDSKATTCCVHAEFPTIEEAKEEERKSDEAIAEYFYRLSAGRCPHCNHLVRQRQVGACVCGSCGHRLYQGKVNPEFAEPRATREGHHD